MKKTITPRAARSIRRTLRRSFCPTGEGGGIDPSCSSGGGGASGGPSYAGMKFDTKSVKVDAAGQIKLSKPKGIDDASAQLGAMTKIMDAAMDDFEAADKLDIGTSNPARAANVEIRTNAGIRLSHARKQMNRALGYTKKALVEELARSRGEEGRPAGGFRPGPDRPIAEGFGPQKGVNELRALVAKVQAKYGATPEDPDETPEPKLELPA